MQELPKVLVIEDDPDIQLVLEDALTEGGFEPAIAASGEEAVTLLKGGLVKYRAMVTDVNLKGRIDGWEVATQSREIDPAFPILYITGAAVGRWPSRGVPNSVLLEEPFAPADCHCGFSASQCPTRRPSRQPIKVWRLLQSESGDESDDESAAYDRFCIAGSLGFP